MERPNMKGLPKWLSAGRTCTGGTLPFRCARIRTRGVCSQLFTAVELKKKTWKETHFRAVLLISPGNDYDA